MNSENVIYTILVQAAKARQGYIYEKLASQLGHTVQHGPFAGMLLPQAASWGDGDRLTKFLGSYEAELHSAIEKALSRKPEIIINVGCAEGYYAIGLARRLPDVPVYAFDIDERAQRVCEMSAEANGVKKNLIIGGRCDVETLKKLVSGKQSLVVMDCEGGERDLLTNDSIAHMSGMDLILECHDFLDRTITPNMANLFVPTHDVLLIREGPRDPSGISFMKRLGALDRYLSVCEFRPEVMNWLACWSRTTNSAA